MPITLNGSGTVSGISAGGLPDGIIQSADLASGVGGKILQVQYAVKKDTASNSLATQTWWSVYNAGFQVTLTPSSASNKILLIAQIMYSEGSGQWYQFRFEKNGAFDSAFAGDAGNSRFRVTSQHDNQTDNNAGRTANMIAQIDAGDTNSRIYNIALRHTSGNTRTVYLNRTATDNDTHAYGRGISTITAMEIAA